MATDIIGKADTDLSLTPSIGSRRFNTGISSISPPPRIRSMVAALLTMATLSTGCGDQQATAEESIKVYIPDGSDAGGEKNDAAPDMAPDNDVNNEVGKDANVPTAETGPDVGVSDGDALYLVDIAKTDDTLDPDIGEAAIAPVPDVGGPPDTLSLECVIPTLSVLSHPGTPSGPVKAGIPDTMLGKFLFVTGKRPAVIHGVQLDASSNGHAVHPQDKIGPMECTDIIACDLIDTVKLRINSALVLSIPAAPTPPFAIWDVDGLEMLPVAPHTISPMTTAVVDIISMISATDTGPGETIQVGVKSVRFYDPVCKEFYVTAPILTQAKVLAVAP